MRRFSKRSPATPPRRSCRRRLDHALRDSAPSTISARWAATRTEDERRFATAERVSEINLALYRTFVQPWSRDRDATRSPERMRNLHPLRLGYEALSAAIRRQ